MLYANKIDSVMKRFTLLLAITIVCQTSSFSQGCLPTGISFTTQAQIDSFQINYSGCTEIEGSVFIEGTEIINLNGLSVINSIGGSLIIANTEIVNLNGLQNLTSVGMSLSIGSYVSWCIGNPSLEDISALSQLTYVGWSLGICGSSITSLDGIENIDASSIFADVIIRENPYLTNCEVESICEYIAMPDTYITVLDNAEGCNSEEEIEEACETVFIDEKTILSDIELYPNPASNLALLSFYCSEKSYISISIYSINNLEIMQFLSEESNEGNYKVKIDCSNLPGGVYFIKLQTSKEIITKKLAIQ